MSKLTDKYEREEKINKISISYDKKNESFDIDISYKGEIREGYCVYDRKFEYYIDEEQITEVKIDKLVLKWEKLCKESQEDILDELENKLNEEF